MSENIIESFFVALGFKVDTTGIETMKAKTQELTALALTVGAIFTGAAIGIGLFARSMAKSLGDTQDFAVLNNLTSRSVEALGKVAMENDGSLEGMRSTIQGLNSKLGEAALGIGRGAMIFKKVGLAARDANGHVKGFDQILEDVADRMQMLSRPEQIALANKLGIDPALIPLLAKGKDNLKALREEAELLNPLSEEDYKLADEVDRLFIKSANSVKVLWKMLAVALFPIVQRVLMAYLAWFKLMRNETASALGRALKFMADAIGTVWDWIMRAIFALKSVYYWFSQFEGIALAVGAVIAALVAYQIGAFFVNLASVLFSATKALFAFNLAALIPVVLIGAFVLAVALLVDELVNFYEGNETLIGQFTGEYPNAIYLVWGALGLLIAGFIALKWAAITSMLETMAIMALYAADWIASHAAMAVSTLAAYAPILLIIAGIALVVGAVWYLWSNWDTVTGLMKAAFGSVFDTVSKVIGAVGSFFGLSSPSSPMASALLTPTNQSDRQLPLQPLGGVLGTAGGVSNSQSTNTSQTTQITGTSIHITTLDPMKAGQAVKQELERMIKQVTRNGQSAVAL